MTKAEILRIQKEREQKSAQENYADFIIFVENEGFIKSIDNVGNFAEKKPIFYRKISEGTYLVFNLPTYDNIKKYGFHADFWKVFVKSQNELLTEKLEDKNKVFIIASFDLKSDFELYKSERSKI